MADFFTTYGITPEQLADALQADGHRIAPAIGSVWADNRWTWLPAGHRRVARVGGIWKTVDGWKVTFHAWTEPDEAEDDQNVGAHGSMFLNHFVADFVPIEETR